MADETKEIAMAVTWLTVFILFMMATVLALYTWADFANVSKVMGGFVWCALIIIGILLASLITYWVSEL